MEEKTRERIILHCDCNNFFASCEETLDPSLKNVPVAVTGNPESRHGIILAKNGLAKGYGIQTAETVWAAKQKCPDLKCVAPHRGVYEEYSRRINQIYLEYTDLVEPFSIDESFLDVTGSLHLFHMTAKELADTLRARVEQEIGITISVGVSFCKVFAKLGSDYKKPNATTVIMREDIPRIVYPLPVSDLLFVGDKSTQVLRSYNIRTCGDLAEYDLEFLKRILGKQGEALYRDIHGMDNAPVRSFYEKREVKSVGNSITFPRDLLGEEEIRAGISELSDSVASRLRKHQLKCYTVQVQIKDPKFHTIQRQRKMDTPTYLKKDIFREAMELITENWDYDKPVRLLSVTGADLCPEDTEVVEQFSLFEQGEPNNSENQEKLEKTMDEIRNRFGKGAIGFGRSTKEKLK